MKQKLLVIAWGVYPSKGGSTIVLNNIISGFEPDEVVIAGQQPQNLPEKPWDQISPIKLYYLDPFPFGVRKPEKYIRWTASSRMISQLEDIVKKEGITAILSIFPDEYYCYLGYRLSKKLKLPYYLWLHNSYLENRKGVLKMFAKYLQPRLFKWAKKVFVMSDGLKKEMSAHYPETKFETLVHGFNLQLPKKEVKKRQSERTKFFYSGALNDSCLDASLRMLRVILEEEDHEIHISSGNPKVFKDNKIEGERVFFQDFVPWKDFVDSLQNYDIMLLPHGIDGARSDFEYRTIFPTRTIPLLFSGKPILAHSPEDSFLTEFLKKNKCALTVTEKSEGRLKEAIEELKKGGPHIEVMVINAKKTSQQFELKRVVQKLKDSIEY